jgi:hypothetical protein
MREEGQRDRDRAHRGEYSLQVEEDKHVHMCKYALT